MTGVYHTAPDSKDNNGWKLQDNYSCNSVKVKMMLHLECKFHFPSAQLMLQQMHVSESI